MGGRGLSHPVSPVSLAFLPHRRESLLRQFTEAAVAAVDLAALDQASTGSRCWPLVPIADAGPVVGQPAHGEVLAELAELEIIAAARLSSGRGDFHDRRDRLVGWPAGRGDRCGVGGAGRAG